MCQIWTAPAANKAMRTTVLPAVVASARIITTCRFQRSARTPAMGPRITVGSTATRSAVARTVAEPVVWVRYQMSANWTTWLPSSEKACPTHTGKKTFFQALGSYVIRKPVFILGPSVAHVGKWRRMLESGAHGDNVQIALAAGRRAGRHP